MGSESENRSNSLDLDLVRAQFPAFSHPDLADSAFFENAGGSYACGPFIRQLENYYTANRVQPYYAFAASVEAGELMDRARRRMARWLNVKTDEVHFGPSTSANTYVLGKAMAAYLEPGDEVIITNQDHEANVGAWQRLEEAGMVVREWQVNPDTFELELEALDELLTERTRLVSFTHCSNIVGTINPVREITDQIRAAGAISVVDGVSYCPHGLPDVAALGGDVYVFSLYKVYGPHLGVMVMRSELNDALPNQGHFFNSEIPTLKFTPAGPDHAQIAAVNGVLDYLESLSSALDENDIRKDISRLFRQQECALMKPLLDFLDGHRDVTLIGRSDIKSRAPTMSFTAKGHEPAVLGAALGEKGLGVGFGHFYAYRLIKALGIDTDLGVTRVSMVHYNTLDEVGRLIEALDELL